MLASEPSPYTTIKAYELAPGDCLLWSGTNHVHVATVLVERGQTWIGIYLGEYADDVTGPRHLSLKSGKDVQVSLRGVHPGRRNI